MQKIAAYLLERHDDMEWPEARMAEVKSLKAMVETWLRLKGASDTGPTGSYQPEDGSAGTFSIQEAVDGDRAWWGANLQEDTQEGRRFSVDVSITSGKDKVSVYVAFETGWTTTLVMPVSVDPRCPRIIRDLFQMPGRWFHGASLLNPSQSASGFEQGENLVREIEYPNRTVPIIVISKDHGRPALPDLDLKLAYDLVGLAKVFIVNEEASWALTDVLGPRWGCYHGAVRIFWPNFSSRQNPFLHPLWTAERLRSRDGETLETRDRFRRQIRELVFRASALSAVRPSEIDEIREAVNRHAFTELRERASSLEDYQKLADSYAVDNDQLRVDLSNTRGEIDLLMELVRRLESDKLALQAHLGAKSTSENTDEEGGIVPVGDNSDTQQSEPIEGETRFYKKVHSRDTHDVMVHVADCGCNKWEGAHKADKAKKGIAKLENDRNDWKNIQHCAACTGGGMWKVRW